jgi:pimeloyl-ACP methyl ester carboxylesterase
MSFPYCNEIKELNDETRKEAVSGAFVRLSDGMTHYELGGIGARVIVLVHGFSVPYFIWDPTFDFLTKSGFRVLRYDLFGRGFSDRPRAAYNIHLFVRQLRDLLDALKITKPIHLAGLSMGGAISTAFVDQYAERVKSHILIDPAGAKPISLSPILKLAKIPGLAELAFGLAGDDSLLKGIASDFYDPALVRQFIDRYRPQMKIKGFKRAILSSIRNGMLGSFSTIYQRVGKLGKPTLLIWGREDTTVPFVHSGLIKAAIPHAEFHAIGECGHIPHYEKPESAD